MPDSSLELPAPAKINLFLHICGRRPDGYHNLQTVFQFLDIGDTLRFYPTGNGAIRLTTPMTGIAHDDNLIVRAARALQQASGCQLGADIAIDKYLPSGAGLGGGSSDAATTLLALNRLWQLDLPGATLAGIGRQLGADVPIFIHGHSAWAEGIGEQLTDMSPAEAWYLLLVPPCHVSTGAIFSHPQLTRHSKMMKIPPSLEPGMAGHFRNDCETLVRQLYPDVDQAFQALSAVGKARMTGTGACVFAAFDNRQQALEASRQMPATMQALVSKGCNESPLHRALGSSV